MAISVLDAAVPGDNDPAGAGAEQIRLIKAALKEDLGGIDGPVKAGAANSLATAAEITNLFDRLTAIEAAYERRLIGTVRPFTGTVAQVPAGWFICDGTNGTPDWQGRVPIGANSAAGAPTLLGQPTGGSPPAATTTGPSGGVSAGTTGGTSLTVAQLPTALANNVTISMCTGGDGITHNDTRFAASGETAGNPYSVPMDITGLNGDTHTHSIPSVATHTHSIPAMDLSPWAAVYWIMYLGV
jgi:hypothetical protein